MMNQPVEDNLSREAIAQRSSKGWAIKGSPILSMALAVAILGTIYWTMIASDRFVSETHVIVQKAELNVAQGFDLGSLFGGFAGGNSHEDQMLLRDYLLSVDMLKKLDERLQLRKHFSSHDHDLLSRMWSEDEPIEWFHRYYLSRISVDFDDYSGVLVIRAQAFSPKMAQAITKMMVSEGEKFMNDLSHRLASEQVDFLEEQVERLRRRAQAARNEVLHFQNKKELVSPQAAIESRVALIAKLEATRADLQTKNSAMKAYLVEDNPAIQQINQQIAAIKKQIEQEKGELASTQKGSSPLNRALEEYQQLELEASFTEETYRSALTALEKGRVEASRKLKKVSVLQAPGLPEYPEEPARLYNSVVFIVFSLILAGMVYLMAAIIRDHKD